MTSPTTPRRSSGFIEPLEARIAPAIIFIGAQGPFENNRDTEYVESTAAGVRDPIDAKLNFVDINNAPAGDMIAASLRGTGATALLDHTVGKYFYLRLHAGDEVVTYTPGSGYDPSKPFISVTGGDAIALFTDSVNDGFHKNDYDTNEFTGLILSAASKVEVKGGVNGDIVTALDNHHTANTADDTLDFAKLVSNKENISNLRVLGGDVNGSVISGGSIDNLVLNNSVVSVLTGSAANGHSFDFFEAGQGDRFSTSITFAAKTAGPNITNANIREIVDRVEAGAGGFGAKGGSLTNITVAADTDGFSLIAGRGGDVDAGSHVTVGGAGGGLNKIIVQGTVDTSFNSVGSLTPILIQGSLQVVQGVKLVAGDGGGSFGGTVATKGGAGGTLAAVTIGSGGSGASSDLSADSFHAFGGKGGDGKTGGLGGSISTTSVTVAARDGAGNEIEVFAGPGGNGGVAGTTGGAAGAGGGLTTITVNNAFSSVDPAVSTHQGIVVKAGAAGLTAVGSPAIGAAGGSIKTVNVLAFDSEVDAGAGSSGNSGGKGGSVTGVTYSTSDAVVPHNMVVNAGRGGDGNKLAGGAGGIVTGVKAAVADIQSLQINNAAGAGRGGNSVLAKGGAGGAISAVDVSERQVPLSFTGFISGDIQIHGGAGGAGATGGGAGGMLANLRVQGDHMAVSASGGAGGAATVKGKGGAGGLINLAFFQSEGQTTGLDANNLPINVNPIGVVVGGAGGAGAGAAGAGGVGGDLRSVSLSDEGTMTLQAGNGGSGANTAGAVKGGAAGKGGSITSSGVISNVGSGFLQAGNAGVDGAAAGAGGSIVGSAATDSVNGVRALNFISIVAGNGSHGGAGGDITALGFEATDASLAPTGTVLVQAGNGSTNGSVAGRGGNITNVTGVASGHVSSTVAPDTRDTRLTAGDGAGAGGNISHVTISGGGADGGIIVVEAGNAGVGYTGKVGAKGGTVTDLGIAGVAAGTLVRSVAAGDGGAGTVKGGAGGSVTQVFVPNGDIGYRTGEKFGYSSQGGIFAGQGGNGPTLGLNGSVSDVTAQSISSIVAGARNSPIPHLAEKVSKISVNGTTGQLLLGQNSIFVGDGDLVITFNGESTALIPAHSTAAEVQAALNLLDSIKAVGMVTVGYTADGGYAISFNNPGNQNPLSALEIVTRDVIASIPNNQALLDIFATGGGEIALPVTEATSGLDPLLATLKTPGSTFFFATETTVGNVVTREVESISLAALGSSAAPEFSLSYLGDQTGHLAATSTAQQVQDALNLLNSIASAGGVTVTLSGAAGPKTYIIKFNFAGREAIIGGQSFVPQVETLDLGAINATTNQFKLSFNGETTAAFLSPLASDAATANEIEGALNTLMTVKQTNVSGTGTVSVTAVGATAPGVFNITFSENGAQPTIAGFANIPEVQKISVTGPLGSKFVIRSGDETTVQLALTATAEQVQNALNVLPNIQTLGGVTVTKTGTDLSVKFNAIGDQASLTSAVLQPLVQAIDLSGATKTTTDYTFNSQYPVLVNEIHPGVTIPLPVSDGDATYTELNDSNRVSNQTAGTSTVPAVQRISFGSGGGGQQALQLGDLFILKYSNGIDPTTATNQNTVVVPFDTNLNNVAANVQKALSALPILAGGVTATTMGAPANTILVTFKNPGVQALLQVEANTPTPHPGEFDLTTSVSVPGSGTAKSVQFIDLDNVIARGGTFKLSFAGQTTNIIPSSNQTVAAVISTALNSLSAISDFGGVTVTETLAGSHLFKVAFNNANFVPGITGRGEVPESEQLDLTGLLADPTNEFSLTFKGVQSYILPKTATAGQIQAALNLMGVNPFPTPPTSIAAEGGVKVFQTATGIFRVDFNKTGTATPDEPNITVNSGGDSTHEIQHFDLRSLSAYTDAQFQLTFSYTDPLTGTTDTETTHALSRDATAQEVQDALNTLSSIVETRTSLVGGNVVQNGAVSVTKTANGQYDAKFNSFGQKDAVSGNGSVETDRFPITVTQTTHGAPGIVSVSETRSGAPSSQSTIETTPGNPTTQEHQKIDLSAFNGAGLGDFTVSFGTDTSAPLQFTGAGVPPDASAVAAAINSLPSIRALNGNADAVTVTGSNGVYDVAFIPKGDEVPLQINARHSEIQQLDLGNVYSTDPTAEGEFTLTFGSQKTATLAHDATALQIQTALNNLSAVQAAGGVDVAESTDPAHPERFSVTFRGLGDQTAITAEAGLTQSVQRITLGDLIGRTDTDFKLTFNGQTTDLLDANLSPAALANEIADALNGLNSIKDTRTAAIDPSAPTTVGHVSVVPGPTGSFMVTFDARGDVPSIDGYSVGTSDRVIPVATNTNGTAVTAPVTSVNGTTTTKEMQTIDLSALGALGAGTEFQLTFDNNLGDAIVPYTTPILTAGNTPAATASIIQNALNALPTIKATAVGSSGSVSVTAEANGTSFDILFSGNGDQQPVSGLVGHHETQTVNITDLSKFRLPVVAMDVSGVPTDGTSSTPEKQLIDFTGIKTDFSLQFGTDHTPSLDAGSDLNTIEDALNALPSVKNTGPNGTGSVTLAASTNNRIEVTFSNNGDQPNLSGTADSSEGVFRLAVGTDTTNALQVGTLSAQDQAAFQGALNSLPNIQGLRGHSQGSVTVSVVNNAYQIDFNTLGNQDPVAATGTFSVLPTLDIHRVTDGAAGSSVNLPITTPTDGQVIGPVPTTLSNGATGQPEVQTLDISQVSSTFTLSFGSDTTGALGGAATASDIQSQLQGLPSISAHGSNAVTVADAGSQGHFNVTFNFAGDQPQIVGNSSSPVAAGTTQNGTTSVQEIQALDLSHLPGNNFQVQFGTDSATISLLADHTNASTNAGLIESALNNLPSIKATAAGNTGNVSVLSNGDASGTSYGNFIITFAASADEPQIAATSFTTLLVKDGGGPNSDHETQHIDVSSLQTVAGSGFQLSYNGGTTVAIDHLASAATVQAALNNLLGANTVMVSGNSGAFDIVFNDTVDHPGLILASGGDREVQHVDTSALTQAGAGQFTLTFGVDQATFPEGTSAATVQNTLNNLGSITAAGGVDVTPTSDGLGHTGYDITFRTFANQPLIVGSINVFEQQILDLHQLPADGGFLQFSANGVTSTYELSNDGPFEKFDIQDGISQLGLGNVSVEEIHTGVFQISFLSAGSQPVIQGVYNGLGNTVRVNAAASVTELESAMDNASVSDVALSADATGHYTAVFADSNSLLPFVGVARTHEQLRVDPYAVGNYTITLFGDTTYSLPVNADADQIRLALNNLNSIKDLGGIRAVTVNPDSSFTVTFLGDDNLDPIDFIARQSLPLTTHTLSEGTATDAEFQSVEYLPLGTFDATKFQNARLVGAIADFNELDSSIFHFLDLKNNPTAVYVPPAFVPGTFSNGQFIAAHIVEAHYEVNGIELQPTAADATHPFVEGDVPVDGIVMAKVIDEKTTNFIPEARLTQTPKMGTTPAKNVFFDYVNR